MMEKNRIIDPWKRVWTQSRKNVTAVHPILDFGFIGTNPAFFQTCLLKLIYSGICVSLKAISYFSCNSSRTLGREKNLWEIMQEKWEIIFENIYIGPTQLLNC